MGKWIQIAELTDVMWSARKVNIGTRSLLSLCASDNTGRFILAGHPTADPRSEFIDTGIWPTWISASHGHNQKIASQIDDSGIALAWLTGEERDVLGDTAAFQGRPYLAKGEYPPRLYHRTTHDAAFSIIDTGFQPGYGSSGKIHSYFAKATLSELENRAGSRANLPYELVISTDEALQHAYMFETTSEGILTRDVILGSCILYVRDTMKGTIIWTRADPDDAEEVIATDAPPQTIIENPEEDDGIFSESLEGIPAPPSGGLEEQQVTKEEIAPGIAKPELPAILDATAADVLPKEESVLDQDQGEQPATPVSRKRGAEEVLYDCEDDDDDELDYGGGIGDMKEEISTMRHRASRQLRCSRYLQPPIGVASIAPARTAAPARSWGQMLCLSCGAAIIKASSQKQRKKIKTARWFAAEAASQAAGKPRSELTVHEVLSEMRRDYSTSRGSQSLDGEALEKAKQQLKQAQKKGFVRIHLGPLRQRRRLHATLCRRRLRPRVPRHRGRVDKLRIAEPRARPRAAYLGRWRLWRWSTS